MLNRSLRYLMCGLSLINVALPALASSAPTTSATHFEPEEVRVEVLGDHRDQNWFWAWGSNAPSMGSGRVLLFDDTGRNLGQLSTGMWFNSLLPSRKRDELYAVETYFSRGVRGERTDVVTVYDSKTLSPKREIAIPAKRMTALISTGLSVLSDDERFLLVFNFTPAQSISIVDLENNRFVKEVPTPGCAAMYSAGPRDFYSICGNGAFLHLKLDDQGQVIEQERSAPLFDPLQDLLLTTGSRKGNTWYFVSQKNFVYGLQMSASGIARSQRWSLVSDQERADGWGVAGNHGTAMHEKSGRLYVLMHQDKPENYQKPGTEVWVYDTKTQQRVSRVKLKELSVAIAVSKDEQPRLYSLDFMIPMPAEFISSIYASKGEAGLMPLMRQSINLYDADSGKHLRSVDDIPAGLMNEVMSW